ncbi:hypothetical protein ACFH04_05685 [Streptomyces noboritoensis]|uniref:Guanylate cyclase domain-containing protein n=1 Tax=Streptomyces noboritoensis TaxID=67337 RepID=A0ABV6TDM6_9ACTN
MTDPVSGTILLFDIEKFSDRDDVEQAYLRRMLYDVADHALLAAGIDETLRRRADRGDSVMELIDAKASLPALLRAVLTDVPAQLRAVNRMASSSAQMRLRAVVATGFVATDDLDGWVGADLNHACRLLDASVLRAALRERPGQDLALCVSESVYAGIVRHNHVGLPAEEFARVTVDSKNGPLAAWLHGPAPVDSPQNPVARGKSRHPSKRTTRTTEPCPRAPGSPAAPSRATTTGCPQGRSSATSLSAAGVTNDDRGRPRSRTAANRQRKAEQPAESDESQDDAESGVDDQPQDAWAARRDLEDHAPRTMRYGARTRFTSGRVGGDNHGVSAGQIVGDVITGTKTEIYYQFGGAAHSSGEVPAAVLERIATHFVTDETHFATLTERLRTDRVLVISGPHFSGRRTAALMLLRGLGATPVRVLDRTTAPSALAQQLGGDGHVLCDLITERDRPLREADVLAARDRLAEKGGHLVITVDPLAALDGIQAAEWKPPAPAAVLQAHLRVAADPETVEKLLALPAVTEFLGRNHQLREAATYAKELVNYALGKTGAQDIERFSQTALERQIQEWFEEDEASLHLRDKAFLVAWPPSTAARTP